MSELKLNRLLSTRNDFAYYRIPGDAQFSCIAREMGHLRRIPIEEALSVTGFVVGTFENDTEALLIEPGSVSDQPYEEPAQSTIPELNYADHQHIAKAYISELKGGHLEKVILSRVDHLPFSGPEGIQPLLEALSDAYPAALVYCMRTSEHGTWVGATPETLLSGNGFSWHTMALAGTKANAQIPWTNKEIVEQEYVADFLSETLKSCQIQHTRSKLETVNAGPVFHLKTDFHFKANGRVAGQFLKAIHPTPAVCGVPVARAKAAIRKNEPHNRMCYTGFLGPVKTSGSASLFVNLRCMRVFRNRVALFLGGGLTSDSNPEHEWDETVNKAKTLSTFIR